MMDMEKQIYEERRASSQFKRRLGLSFMLCLFGAISFGGFLGYRHYHPLDLTPVTVEVDHTDRSGKNCPHKECVAAHTKLERPTEYAPSVLAGLMLLYCTVAGLGAFGVEMK